MAIQASRLTTALHKASTPGTIPTDSVHGCPQPCSSIFGSSQSLLRFHLLCLRRLVSVSVLC